MSMSPIKILLLMTLPAWTAACTGSPTSSSSTVAFSQTDLRVGAGAPVVSGTNLTVNYTGWLHDAAKPDQKGLQFDSSIGRTPFSFTLGSGQVIAGWEQGLAGMTVGGLRRLVIPPSLAYGGTRSGPIPPNTTLVFEVAVVTAQ